MMPNFSSQAMQARKQWTSIFKVLKEKQKTVNLEFFTEKNIFQK